MSTDRDITRIVRSWLRTDETDSADRVLGTVLDRLDATPQRTATWWPARRISQMNTTVKLVVGVAAAVLVALVGFTIVNGTAVGGPAPTPSPEPTPAPTPAARQLPSVGDLEAGTYRVDDAGITLRSFTLTVPDGWATEEGFVTKGGADDIRDRDLMVTSWIVSHVFADACLRPGTSAEGLIETTTAQELVDALVRQGGHET
jgi:hypothetical protein